MEGEENNKIMKVRRVLCVLCAKRRAFAPPVVSLYASAFSPRIFVPFARAVNCARTESHASMKINCF